MDGLIGFIVVLVVTIIIFLIGREIVLWYFRINEKMVLLQSIDARLALLVEKED